MEEKRYRTQEQDGFTLVVNEGGAVLGTACGALLFRDGYAFKNLSGQDGLLPYEDWRLDDRTRAEDLAGRLSLPELAGLMLHASHQLVPFVNSPVMQGSYGGRPYTEDMDPWALTDGQKDFLLRQHGRTLLLMKVKDAATAARWNNELQRTAEKEAYGIPVMISSDPRHGASENGAEFKSAGEDVSKWPEGVGMAAIGDPALTERYARIAAKEYRAMGITVALGPQVDWATDPRWMRFEDTFGSDFETVKAMAAACCDGLQTTEGSEDGWGSDSVIAMAKHWPGGATGEGGRDAHYRFGKYAVYPGGNFEAHTKIFTGGAFALKGGTGKAASVMPYYTVSWGTNREGAAPAGNSYNEHLIRDLLRGTYAYDGVVCTDWGITGDPDKEMDCLCSHCYGVENLTEAERHLVLILNGIDQFGGNNDAGPILKAVEIGSERYGAAFMRQRLEASAVRILTNMFRVGLFENPYLDPAKSARVVGQEAYVSEGFRAQMDSLVLLKNRGDVLPLAKGSKIYVPARTIDAHKMFFRLMQEGETQQPLTAEDLAGFGELVDSPEEADAAVVFVESPLCDPYQGEYLPITLQYRPYTAEAARPESIAQDASEEVPNRTYRGKTNAPYNQRDLDLILDARARMGDRPVIVCTHLHNPSVVSEYEPSADAILAQFGVQKRAVLSVLFGDHAPKGRLPFIMPRDMETVERHCEDVPDDIIPYTDGAGNTYTFGYGLSYSGTQGTEAH